MTSLQREGTVQPVQSGDSELRRIGRELALALGAIRFGSIEIVIHDGRVTQIERRERVRFDDGAAARGRIRR